MDVVLLIGAAPYRLGEGDARWLEKAIRQACLDDHGRPLALDDSIRATIQLADVLRTDLDRGSSPEPIELGRLQVAGLLTFVFGNELARKSAGIVELHAALRRFSGRG